MKSSSYTRSLLCNLIAVLLLALAPSGCSKKVTVDTMNLDYSFQTDDSTNHAVVTQAIEAIEKGDVATAKTKLEKVAADPKLTDEQKTAVNGVLQQLEKK